MNSLNKIRKEFIQIILLGFVVLFLANSVFAKIELNKFELAYIKSNLNIPSISELSNLPDEELIDLLTRQIDPEKLPGLTYAIYSLLVFQEIDFIDWIVSQRFHQDFYKYFNKIVAERTKMEAHLKNVWKDIKKAIKELPNGSFGALSFYTFDITNKLLGIGEVTLRIAEQEVCQGLWRYLDDRRNNLSHKESWEDAKIEMGWMPNPNLVEEITNATPSWARKAVLISRIEKGVARLEPWFSELWNKWGDYIELEGVNPKAKEMARKEIQTALLKEFSTYKLVKKRQKPSLFEQMESKWESFRGNIKKFTVFIKKEILQKTSKPLEKVKEVVLLFFSKIEKISPATLIRNLFQKEDREPSIKIITEKSGEIKFEQKEKRSKKIREKDASDKDKKITKFFSTKTQEQERIEDKKEIAQEVGQKDEDKKEKLKEKEIQDEKEKKKEEKAEVIICQRVPGDSPRRNRIIINEIAWMGTTESYNDEWIEFKNISGIEIDLTGWQLLDKDQNIKIIFGRERISSNSFYLLERTDDNSVPQIEADFIYTGSLKNTDEALYLFDENCQLQDEVLANPDWPAGDNESKRTMERKTDFSWQTSLEPGGTPKRENSSGYVEVEEKEVSTTGITKGGGAANQTQFFSIIINEIMYNPEGSDKEREWIEVFNNGEASVDISNWKFYEGGVNHRLNLIQGSPILLPKSYALITNGQELKDFSNYSGTLFRASFSLKNSEEEIALKNGDLIIDSLTYNSSWGANGNGNSLQRILPKERSDSPQNWKEASPTPGKENQFLQTKPPKLEVSPNSLEFSLNSNSKTISISNIGGGTLNWQSKIEYLSPSPKDWLSLSLASGTILSNSTMEIFVSPIQNTSGVGDGIYLAKINIDAGEIEGSPAQINVSWNVQSLTDKTSPTVYFNELLAEQKSIFFTLSWWGEDPQGAVSPSGIESFYLKYDTSPSDLDGTYLSYKKDEIWYSWQSGEILKTLENQLEISGKDGYTFTFQIKAKDKAGNESDWKEISTKINLPFKELSVVINEIGWAGTKASPYDEWIELYNTTKKDINLFGWKLISSDGSPNIVFGSFPKTATLVTTTILADGFYLIERTDDKATSEPANWMGSFGGGLSNSNCEVLFLYDPYENLIDKTSCLENNNWPAGEGSPSYISMERINPLKSGSDPNNWANNNLFTRNGSSSEKDGKVYPIFGTPKAKNSVSKTETEIEDFPFGEEFNQIKLTFLGSPYILEGKSFLVPKDKTLIIEPGVILKFKEKGKIQVEGTLKAEGGKEKPIIFTKYEGSAGNYWSGISLSSTSKDSIFDWVVIEKAKSDDSYHFALKVDGANLILKNSEIKGASNKYQLFLKNSSIEIENAKFLDPEIGIEEFEAIHGVGSTLTIRNSTFQKNPIGIKVTANSNLIVQNCIFKNNEKPVYLFSSSISAQNNQFENNTINGILIGPEIQTSITLEADSPFIVKENLNIFPQATLILVPKTEMKFKDQVKVTVQGKIIAQGTIDQKITFTSFNENSWYTFYFVNSGSSLNNTIIKKGGGSKNGVIFGVLAILKEDSSGERLQIEIKNSMFESNKYSLSFISLINGKETNLLNCQIIESILKENKILESNNTFQNNEIDIYPSDCSF